MGLHRRSGRRILAYMGLSAEGILGLALLAGCASVFHGRFRWLKGAALWGASFALAAVVTSVTDITSDGPQLLVLFASFAAGIAAVYFLRRCATETDSPPEAH